MAKREAVFVGGVDDGGRQGREGGFRLSHCLDVGEGGKVSWKRLGVLGLG